MSSKGPKGNEAASETDENPSEDEVLASVRWAVTTENVELANFYLDVGETERLCYQIFGGATHNLTELDEERQIIAADIFRDFGATEEQIREGWFEGRTAIDVEFDLPVEEHQTLAERVLSEVYDVGLDDVTRIDRSTHAANDHNTNNGQKEIVACNECGCSLILEATVDDNSSRVSLGPDLDTRLSGRMSALDMIPARTRQWVCVSCYGKIGT